MRKTLFVALFALLALQPPPESVVLDFFAVTVDGRPVADLSAAAVTVKLDGRPRTIRSLEWVPIVTPDADPLPAPFGTNAASDDGRLMILIVDDDSFRPGRERPLRDAVSRFLVELNPRDRIALVTMPYGGLKVDFTTDRQAVGKALSTIVGQASSDQTGSELACRTRRTLESLTGLLEGFRGAVRPMTVVFFSSALAAPRRDAAQMLAPGPCEITSEMFRQVGVAAGAARAHFYLVQPDDVMVPGGARPRESIAGVGFSGSDNPLEGLEHLAGITGGPQLQLTTGQGTGLDRVGRETAGYYLAAFEPGPSDRNGASHQIEVRAARSDVVIRSTSAITIAKADARAASDSTDPRAMLRNARVFRDLPLRGVGLASRNASGNDAAKVKILAVVEPADPSARLSSAAAGLFDAAGRLVAQWTASDAELRSTPVMTALVAPPGTYRLRVAATDASKRAGTADSDVVAVLTPAGPLTISALVLGLSRGGAFQPKLQFGAEPVAIGYLEVYGPPQTAPVSVTLEIAKTVNGPALLRIPGAMTPTSDADRLIVTAALPIGGLPVGDVVVRAIVGVGGQPAGRVMRTLRKAP